MVVEGKGDVDYCGACRNLCSKNICVGFLPSIAHPRWSSWLWHPAVMEYCYRVVGGSTPVGPTIHLKVSRMMSNIINSPEGKYIIFFWE